MLVQMDWLVRGIDIVVPEGVGHQFSNEKVIEGGECKEPIMEIQA